MITQDIQLCVDALTRGEVVAFPTETVFGLGARSDSPEAIRKIYDIKGRPADHPLIAHCSDVDVALALSPDVPDYARALAAEFWPGPMTLIFRRAGSDAICDEAVGGHDTVAIRVPSHEIARELLAPCGFFVSAPSANKFGRVSPTTTEHVRSEFGDDILILDGEPSQCGVESTIISCTGSHPHVIRAGAITTQDILRVTGHDVSSDLANSSDDNVAAPGTLENHYAPRIPVYVVADEQAIEFTEGLSPENSAFLSFGQPSQTFLLSLVVHSYDDYARQLYDFFRQAEVNGCEAIFAVAPENEGIGVAINDRLSKASHSLTESSNG